MSQNDKVTYRNQLINQNLNTKSTGNLDILNEAANKGFSLNIKDFIKFANMLKGKDINGIFDELVESGQMNQEMYDSLKLKAQGLLGLSKLLR